MENYGNLVLYVTATLANYYFVAITLFHWNHFYELKGARHLAAGLFACAPLIIGIISFSKFSSVHVGYILWMFSLQATGILEFLHTSKFNKFW